MREYVCRISRGDDGSTASGGYKVAKIRALHHQTMVKPWFLRQNYGLTATFVGSAVFVLGGRARPAIFPTLVDYKSPNNDLLGWLAEELAGRPLRELLADIVEAAGIEHAFHVSCDRK